MNYRIVTTVEKGRWTYRVQFKTWKWKTVYTTHNEKVVKEYFKKLQK